MVSNTETQKRTINADDDILGEERKGIDGHAMVE